jgi:hypothetical protein
MTSERLYGTPAALEQALGARIKGRYPADEFQARRSEVAYRRLVARMFATSPDEWVLKGGYAMILRLDPNRTSNDIDVAYVKAAGEHAVALRELERATQHDLDDFFSFEIVRVGDEGTDRARRVTVRCRLGVREFTTFRVDLAVPATGVPSDELSVLPPLVGVSQVDDSPPVRVVRWTQQIADKVCAMFEVHAHGHSSRVRDLGDLGMISAQVDDIDGDELISAVRSEEARRKPASLPDGLPKTLEFTAEQDREWRRAFPRATRNAAITYDDALVLARQLLNPALDGSATGRTWRGPQAGWT